MSLEDKQISAHTVVIGGGASGLICAYFAAQSGKRVILLDKNERLGRKLRITGKGRCNVTNACDISSFMQNVCTNGRFLYSALSSFSPYDTIAFFEDHGLPLKVERGNRVFPQSDNANDVASLLISLCEKQRVSIYRQKAESIQTEHNRVTGVRTDQGFIACRTCVICTGGLSYPLTGSTGDGYCLAEKLGHTLVQTQPGLVPLESSDMCCQRLQGLSLRNVMLRVFCDEAIRFKEQGELLFTHYGISGPIVLSASSHLKESDFSACRAEIDLKPALDFKTLDQRMQRDFLQYKNKDLKNALIDLLPKAMIPEIIICSGVPENQKINSLTRSQRTDLVAAIKAFPINLKGKRSFEEAIITAGGINVREINPHTMESQLIDGLYFAGEVLDLDALTGGYNLQIAWSTGRLAGISAGRKNDE